MEKSGRTRKRNVYRIALLFAALTAVFFTVFVYRYMDEAVLASAQEEISGQILRFHVIANSDSEADQKMKLHVRDGILDYLQQNMPQTDNVSDTVRWVKTHIDEIEDSGREVLRKNGSSQTLNASVAAYWFSDRTFKDMLFPAGNYEALRIEIGSAKGHNWWCVLYPGLCFLDTANIHETEKKDGKLKNVLTEEEYSRVTAYSDFRIGWYFW